MARRRGLCALAALGCALLLGGCAGYEPVAGAAQFVRGDVPGTGTPAGIKFYTRTDDGVFLLLADHVFPIRRGWADFGGAADAGETIAQTAAREAEEETRGYFKRENLLEAIAGQEPILVGSYAFYFVEVEKVPAETIRNHPVRGVKLAYRERGPYAWVPYSEIERYLEADPAHYPYRHTIDSSYLPESWWATNWFWPPLLGHLRAAKAANALPWEQAPAEH